MSHPAAAAAAVSVSTDTKATDTKATDTKAMDTKEARPEAVKAIGPLPVPKTVSMTIRKWLAFRFCIDISQSSFFHRP